MSQSTHAHAIEAREVFERLRERMRDNDGAGVAALLAEDAVVEWPFTRPGVPRRLEGRDAFRQFVARLAVAPLMRFEDLYPVAVHDTADPEVIVTETLTRGTVVATGRRFELPAIAVLRIRGGEIVHWRDYVDPVAAARAVGGLPRLFEALSEEEEEEEA